MVYLIDEYYKQHPERENLIRPVFDKFISAEKYLHEMSLDELNEIVKDWVQKPNTIEARRGALSLYLYWLKEQGINANPDIAKGIVFSERENQFLIYSTDDIHSIWKDFVRDIDITAEKKGKVSSTEPLLVCYVAGILGFYGMTKQQIMSLQLSDVQNDGIVGYDLPLTSKDKEVLLKYKDLDTLANRQPLLGTGYIRSSRTEHPNELILDKALGKVDCSQESKPLMSLLTYSSLYKLGLMGRVYEYEKTHRPTVDNGFTIPDWFKDMINESMGKVVTLRTISQYKQNYIAYRTERNAYKNVLNNKVKYANSQNVNDIIVKLDSIINSISDVKIQNELKNIQNQIRELVK